MCFGTTTRYFVLRSLRHSGHHHACETKIREPFKLSMQQLGLWNQFTALGDSMLTPFSGQIQFLFIDSEHALSDALGEYMRFRRYLEAGGIVGFHDSNSCWGVREAIDIIKTIDELELVSECVDQLAAGIEFYRLKALNVVQNARSAEMLIKNQERIRQSVAARKANNG